MFGLEISLTPLPFWARFIDLKVLLERSNIKLSLRKLYKGARNITLSFAFTSWASIAIEDNFIEQDSRPKNAKRALCKLNYMIVLWVTCALNYQLWELEEKAVVRLVLVK